LGLVHGNYVHVLRFVSLTRSTLQILAGLWGVLHLHALLPSTEPDEVLLQRALHGMLPANQKWHRLQNQCTLPVLQGGLNVWLFLVSFR
jgi:hypothetical protein